MAGRAKAVPFFLFLLLVSASIPPSLFCADSPGSPGGESVSIREYSFEEYERHPRMKQEDALRGRTFTWSPGLEIITDVDDCEVRVFGEPAGRTPWESNNLAAGAYRINLRRTGYPEAEFRVTLNGRDRTVVYAVMSESRGILSLRGLPPGAEVKLDRRPVEGTDIPAMAGERFLEIRAFGWEPVGETVSVVKGETTEWEFEGVRTEFSIEFTGVRPRSLPSDDPRGFLIPWRAAAPGRAILSILDSRGSLVAEIPVEIDSPEGAVRWPADPGEFAMSVGDDSPSAGSDSGVPDGEYRVVIEGTGNDGVADSAETELRVDSRFERRPRLGNARIPGLAYAPGTAVLPPGVFQLSTGAGMDIGTASSSAAEGVPAHLSFRVSPAAGWEVSGRLGITTRDPRENTGIDLSLSGGWLLPIVRGPFSAKLALLFSYSGASTDFTAIPAGFAGPWLPGPSLAMPMELSLGRLSLVFSPAGHLFFFGENPAEPRFAAPVRFAGSLGFGAYCQGRDFLVGASAAVRTPDAGGEMLDWTLWTGLEGRFDFPGHASFLGGSAGIRSLDADPVVQVDLEFGIIL